MIVISHANMNFLHRAGVTEEQFKESWTRPGAVGLGEGAVMVAKSRM